MALFLRRNLFSKGSTYCRILSAHYSSKTGTTEHIDSLVKDKKLVVFMKGTPKQPMCGFSNGIIQILNFHGVGEFDAHDVLEDEDLRQGHFVFYNVFTRSS